MDAAGRDARPRDRGRSRLKSGATGRRRDARAVAAIARRELRAVTGRGGCAGRGVRGPQPALAPGGGALVHDALGRAALSRSREASRGALACGLAVALGGREADLLRGGLQRGADRLVALGRLLVLRVALDLGLDVGHRGASLPAGPPAVPRVERPRTMDAAVDRHLPHPELLHRGPYRPREVDAGRPAARAHPHGRGPR